MEESAGKPTAHVIAEGVLARTVGDEVVIMDLNSETYFGLNPSGKVVWTKLEAQAPPSEMVDALVDRFEVTTERAAADVAKLLDTLVRSGLVRQVE